MKCTEDVTARSCVYRKTEVLLVTGIVYTYLKHLDRPRAVSPSMEMAGVTNLAQLQVDLAQKPLPKTKFSPASRIERLASDEESMSERIQQTKTARVPRVGLSTGSPEINKMSKTQPPPGFDEMSVSEQIDYVNSLWERIASCAPDVPVPDWHCKVLEDRLKLHREEPDDVQQWDEVRDNARDKVRRARQ